MPDIDFPALVARAALAPTVHNTQPGHRMAARIDWQPGGPLDALARQLEARFTHRGAFMPDPVALSGWGRVDTVLVTDAAAKDWLAGLHDQAGLQVMRNRTLRQELLGWMRLSRCHRRYWFDGLGREALRLSVTEAMAARLVLGPLWPLLDRLGLTAGLTAEAGSTRSAQVVACFHRPAHESPVTTGRAYLRLCLEAAALGLAGWPMAAVSDQPQANAAICARTGIGPDRRLVQVIRFGVANAAPPPQGHAGRWQSCSCSRGSDCKPAELPAVEYQRLARCLRNMPHLPQNDHMIACVMNGIGVAFKPGQTALNFGGSGGRHCPGYRTEGVFGPGESFGHVALAVAQHMHREPAGCVEGLEPAGGFRRRPQDQCRIE